MKIGIKYCGGCNPKHDRVMFVSLLKQMFQNQMEFEAAIEGTIYDALLVVGGCKSSCADYKKLNFKQKLIIVTDFCQLNAVVKELCQLIAIEVDGE